MFAGFNAATTTGLGTGTTAERTIAVVDFDGNVDTTTRWTAPNTGENWGGLATADLVNFYTTGSNGTRYVSYGAASVEGVQLAAGGSLRGAQIGPDGALYMAAGNANGQGVLKPFASPLPTAASYPIGFAYTSFLRSTVIALEPIGLWMEESGVIYATSTPATASASDPVLYKFEQLPNGTWWSPPRMAQAQHGPHLYLQQHHRDATRPEGHHRHPAGQRQPPRPVPYNCVQQHVRLHRRHHACAVFRRAGI